MRLTLPKSFVAEGQHANLGDAHMSYVKYAGHNRNKMHFNPFGTLFYICSSNGPLSSLSTKQTLASLCSSVCLVVSAVRVG